MMTAITLATYSPKTELEHYIRKNIARAAKTSTLSTTNATGEEDTSTLSTTQVCC